MFFLIIIVHNISGVNLEICTSMTKDVPDNIYSQPPVTHMLYGPCSTFNSCSSP